VQPAQPSEDDEPDVGTLAGLRLGVQTLVSDRVLLALVVSLLTVTFIYGFELVYLVLVARDLLGMGASGVGYLDAAASLTLDVVAITLMQRVIPGSRLARVEGLLFERDRG
jgi:hypothetical protein